MTGYGECEIGGDGYTVSCEARSVNGRFLNISIKLPESLQSFEQEIRRAIRSKLRRGSVNVTVRVDETTPRGYEVNRGILDHYLSLFKELHQEAGTEWSPDPVAFFSLPGVLINPEPEPDLKMRRVILSAVVKSLDLAVKMRIEEGKSLAKDLRQRLGKIKRCVDRIDRRSTAAIKEKKKTLKRRIEEFLTDYDRQRLNLEILMQIDKFDIKEELVRLRSHLSHFRKILDERIPIGSKLTYLTQEMQREANTLSVKSMDGSISLFVISIKEELERIREQLQNVE
jgi:uncharacterized protein (TIGR00255 family)